MIHYIHTRLAVRDDEGATAVEYGLMVALIALIIIAGASLLGTNLNALFSEIATSDPIGG